MSCIIVFLSVTATIGLTRISEQGSDNIASHPYVLVCAIGETARRPEQRVKEHQNVCKIGDENVSAIAEHAWQQHHPIEWEVVGVVNRASMNCEIKVKEALYIQMTPDNNKYYNRDMLRASRMLAINAVCKSPFRK